MRNKRRPNFDEKGFPNRAGIYEVMEEIQATPNNHLVQVYRYRPKGLCCFKDDIDSEGTGVDPKHDAHVSVQFTGLTFLRRVANLTDFKYSNLD